MLFKDQKRRLSNNIRPVRGEEMWRYGSLHKSIQSTIANIVKAASPFGEMLEKTGFRHRAGRP
jgi:hypothetical protein